MGITSRAPGWVGVAAWICGLVAGAVGADLFSVAVEGYRSANPHLGSDFYHIPAPSTGESSQATLAAGLLLIGVAAVLVAVLMGVRTTAAGWMLLRSLGALSSIPIVLVLAQPGLQGYFHIYVDVLCGDCTPPAPSPPWGAFAMGVTVLALGVLASVVVSLVLIAFAIRGFIVRRRPG
jgi:hypothetical protein